LIDAGFFGAIAPWVRVFLLCLKQDFKGLLRYKKPSKQYEISLGGLW
jgi:hypothetical protein